MITLEEYDNQKYKKFLSAYIDEKSLNTLQGLLTGITLDSKVNETEAKELKAWLEINKKLKEIKPYDLIFTHLEAILEDDKVDPEEVEDIKYLTEKLFLWTEADILVTQGIRELHGIFQGLLIDKQLSDQEISNLFHWLIEHDNLKGSYPFDEIETLLTHTLKDKIITAEENELITSFISQFTSQERLTLEPKHNWEQLKKKYSISAICSTDPEISFQNKCFCFTGESKHKKRAEIAEVIQSLGGIFQNNVTQKTNFLIVGAKGNDCWAFTGYGRKIEKAIDLRKNGTHLQIIHENDFWDSI